MKLPDEIGDIAERIPAVILDIRYASTHNFTGAQQYDLPVAWLRHEPLQHLHEAAEEFMKNGYRLVIYDAFRPTSVQDRLREVVSDDNYVMEISNHCRGITIDATLATQDGAYLDMGTEYDDFTEKAHPGTTLITNEQTSNRQLFSSVLARYGFKQHSHEWWHFDYHPERAWAVIDDHTNTFEK